MPSLWRGFPGLIITSSFIWRHRHLLLSYILHALCRKCQVGLSSAIHYTGYFLIPRLLEHEIKDFPHFLLYLMHPPLQVFLQPEQCKGSEYGPDLRFWILALPLNYLQEGPTQYTAFPWLTPFIYEMRISALGSWKGYVKYHSTAVLANGKLTINVIPYFKYRGRIINVDLGLRKDTGKTMVHFYLIRN